MVSGIMNGLSVVLTVKKWYEYRVLLYYFEAYETGMFFIDIGLIPLYCTVISWQALISVSYFVNNLKL